MYKSIYLKKGKEESLKRFHPWVFSGAIAGFAEKDEIEEGEVVRVLTNEGDFIAVGHYQIGSIAVRVLSFSDVEINDGFWKSRLASALNARLAIGIADKDDNDTYRLVHGEGDNLPGLIVDCYGKTAVMQAHSVDMLFVMHWLRCWAQELRMCTTKVTLPYPSKLNWDKKMNLSSAEARIIRAKKMVCSFMWIG